MAALTVIPPTVRSGGVAGRGRGLVGGGEVDGGPGLSGAVRPALNRCVRPRRGRWGQPGHGRRDSRLLGADARRQTGVEAGQHRCIGQPSVEALTHLGREAFLIGLGGTQGRDRGVGFVAGRFGRRAGRLGPATLVLQPTLGHPHLVDDIGVPAGAHVHERPAGGVLLGRPGLEPAQQVLPGRVHVRGEGQPGETLPEAVEFRGTGGRGAAAASASAALAAATRVASADAAC